MKTAHENRRQAQNRNSTSGPCVTPILSFDQLYVVSDLHFGGEAGLQMFGSQEAMLWLIGELAKRDPEQELALVINGDFIDFLAESNPRHFDPEGAVAKLERIALSDSTFKPVFDALRGFVSTANRHLIVNLGNHDLELALPWVRRRLVELLGGDAVGHGGHLHMVLDGTGVRCSVGGRSVLCVHGNEVDRWNPADFEKIREIGRDTQLGRPVESWIPNAGTQMVIDVMNGMKRRYPFVDLLKPEKDAVVPVLAACDPSQLASLDRLVRLAAVAGNWLTASVRKPRGMLDEDAQAKPLPAGTAFARINPVRTAEMMMHGAEASARRGIDPMELVEGQEAEQLGKIAAFWKGVTGQPTDQVLREALEKLDNDRSFDIHDYDDTAKALDAEISPAIDFLVAGHTHLERALARRNGNGVYFNSGTWARLLGITRDVRRDAAAFEKLFKVLQDGDMAQLDKGAPVLKPNTVVVIRAVAAGATGELQHVGPLQGQPAIQYDLLPVEGSSYTRVG